MNLLGTLTSLYMLLIFIRIMLTWFTGTPSGKPGIPNGKPLEILSRVTDPYLNWFRRFPALRFSSMDLSPILGLTVLSVANSVFNTLGRYGTITLGFVLALVVSALWSAAAFILSFLIIILGLRLAAYLTNRNVYQSFWRIIDSLAQPILYRISRIIFGNRLVNYLNSLIVAIAALLILRIGGGLLINLGIGLLTRLPL
jgi:YggT family protein